MKITTNFFERIAYNSINLRVGGNILTDLSMRQFKTKFNYSIFIAFVLMSIFGTGLFFLFIIRLTKGIVEHQSLADTLKFFFVGLFLFGYLFLMTGHLLLITRHSFSIADNEFYLYDNLFFRRQNITDDVKGYSRTKFGQRQYSMNNYILYLKDRRKINLPKFMIRNFNDIEQAFAANNIMLLGDEPFKWKNIIQRKYQFD